MAERHKQAYELYERGMTYKQVGDAMGVSAGRARQLAVARQRHLEWIAGNPNWEKERPEREAGERARASFRKDFWDHRKKLEYTVKRIEKRIKKYHEELDKAKEQLSRFIAFNFPRD